MKNPFFLYAAIAFFAVILGAAILAPRRSTITDKANVVDGTGNSKLAEAVIRARSELPQFIDALKTHPEAEFAICARFITRNGPEQLWVKVDSYENKTFRGTLAVDPVAYEKKKGDAVEVKENMVVDWTYRLEGKTEGGYTTKVLGGR